MKIIIEVTQRDINLGYAKQAMNCPIARACNRHKQFNKASCYDFIENRSNSRLLWRVEMPIKAFQFIQAFDTGKLVKPFSFDLEIPDA